MPDANKCYGRPFDFSVFFLLNMTAGYESVFHSVFFWKFFIYMFETNYLHQTFTNCVRTEV